MVSRSSGILGSCRIHISVKSSRIFLCVGVGVCVHDAKTAQDNVFISALFILKTGKETGVWIHQNNRLYVK